MTTSIDFEPLAGEPLSLLASRMPRTDAFPGARAERLEFSCRGDRVPATLIVPSGDGPFPLVLLQQPSESADRLDDLRQARSWVEAGCALAATDLPLQGARRSAKLSDLLAASIDRAARGEAIADTATLLWCEFARQATLELRRMLDIIAALPTIDANRIGFAGFGLGAFVGALVCGVDPRPAAVVLANPGAGFAPPAIDPAAFVQRIAPRPLLLLHEDTLNPNIPERPERLAKNPTTPLESAWKFLQPNLGL